MPNQRGGETLSVAQKGERPMRGQPMKCVEVIKIKNPEQVRRFLELLASIPDRKPEPVKGQSKRA